MLLFDIKKWFYTKLKKIYIFYNMYNLSESDPELVVKIPDLDQAKERSGPHRIRNCIIMWREFSPSCLQACMSFSLRLF